MEITIFWVLATDGEFLSRHIPKPYQSIKAADQSHVKNY